MCVMLFESHREHVTLQQSTGLHQQLGWMALDVDYTSNQTVRRTLAIMLRAALDRRGQDERVSIHTTTHLSIAPELRSHHKLSEQSHNEQVNLEVASGNVCDE